MEGAHAPDGAADGSRTARTVTHKNSAASIVTDKDSAASAAADRNSAASAVSDRSNDASGVAIGECESSSRYASEFRVSALSCGDVQFAYQLPLSLIPYTFCSSCGFMTDHTGRDLEHATQVFNHHNKVCTDPKPMTFTDIKASLRASWPNAETLPAAGWGLVLIKDDPGVEHLMKVLSARDGLRALRQSASVDTAGGSKGGAVALTKTGSKQMDSFQERAGLARQSSPSAIEHVCLRSERKASANAGG